MRCGGLLGSDAAKSDQRATACVTSGAPADPYGRGWLNLSEMWLHNYKYL